MEELVACPDCNSTYDYEITGVWWGGGVSAIQMTCKCGCVFDVHVSKVVRYEKYERR